MGYNLKIVVWWGEIDIWWGKYKFGGGGVYWGEFLGGRMSKFLAGGGTPPPPPHHPSREKPVYCIQKTT